MKITINDEYSNLGEEFNIILDEYSNKQEMRLNNVGEDDDKERDTECCNATYYESEDNRFNVELQYSEETSYKEDKSKYDEYDKFYYKNELQGNKLNCDQNGNNIDYEKYYNESYEKKYVEECEDCSDHRIIDGLSVCPEELMSENGYGAAKQEYNSKYSEDYTNSYPSTPSYLNNNYEPDYKNCENNNNSCENNYKKDEDSYNSSENNYENVYQPKPNCRKGRIEVLVKLGDKNGIEIKGAKINLYELNGVCPKLYESKLTDCNGKAIFGNLENGCYRVISLVDRSCFEKPTYITWNEVTIDDCVKDASICVVNKIKPSCCKR